MTTVITLNLLAEEQLAKQERARDPFKAALAIGMSAVTLAVGAGLALSYHVSGQRTHASNLQSRLDRLNMARLADDEGAFKDTRTVANDLLAINRGRTLFAPQMALIKDLIPTSVQLTRYALTMAVESSDSLLPVAGDAGKGGKRPPRPRLNERLVLQLEGRAVSNRPEIEVDKFMQGLRADSRFTALVDDIQLRSIARAPIMGNADAPAVPASVFVIECRYKQRDDTKPKLVKK